MTAALGVLSGLFCAAFLSATLLPAQSELALGAALLYSDVPAWLSISAAWIGNTAGSCLNWLIGLASARLAAKKGAWISGASMAKAESWYKKYGRWSLFASWVPIIGDPITVAAGALGESFRVFILIVAAAKLARYLALALLIL